MGDVAKNILKLEPFRGGSFRLSGYINGKRIRKRSRDYSKLVKIKDDEEAILAKQQNLIAGQPQLRPTTLSHDDLRGAEGLKRRSGGLSWEEMADIIEDHRPSSTEVTCVYALAMWIADLNERHRFAATVAKNKYRVKAFLKQTQTKEISALTNEILEGYILRDGVSQRTQISDGQVLRAWLNFCVRKKWLRRSPFEIDLEDLAARAKPVEKPKILHVDQCRALVDAAATLYRGEFLAYVGLTLFLFLRHAEAVRTTPDLMKLDRAKPVVEVNPRKRGTASYRLVDVPVNVLPMLKQRTVVFSRHKWERIREAAGLIERAPQEKRGGNQRHTKSVWQDNILRHTGISYFYQKTGDIKETARQAGNSSDVSFRHYLQLPQEGASEKFYAITSRAS